MKYKYSVKRYGQWVNESASVNEGFLDAVKGAASAIKKSLSALLSKIPGLRWNGKEFEGTSSWIMNRSMMSGKPGFGEVITVGSSLEGEILKEIGTEQTPVETAAPSPVEANSVLESSGNTDFDQFMQNMLSKDKEMINVGLEQVKDEILKQLFTLREINEKYPVGTFAPEDAYLAPLFVWGTVGVAKTATMKALTESLKTFNLNVLDADDFSLPYLEAQMNSSSRRRAKSAPSDLFPMVDTELRNKEDIIREEESYKPTAGDVGIIFLDELSSVEKRGLLKMLLSLICDRQINQMRLSRYYLIVCAGNREQDMPTMVKTFGQLKALLNRFKHVNLVPDPQSWIDYQRSHEFRLASEPGELTCDPIIIDYIDMNRAQLHQFDPGKKTSVFPTNRTWENACKDMRQTEKWLAHKSGGQKRKLTPDEFEEILAGHIGKGVASDAKEFYRVATEVDPRSFYKAYTSDWKSAPQIPKGSSGTSTLGETFAYARQAINAKKGEKLTGDELINFAWWLGTNVQEGSLLITLMTIFYSMHPYFKTIGRENTKEERELLKKVNGIFVSLHPDQSKEDFFKGYVLPSSK